LPGVVPPKILAEIWDETSRGISTSLGRREAARKESTWTGNSRSRVGSVVKRKPGRR
jgi:hypothetical protein